MQNETTRSKKELKRPPTSGSFQPGNQLAAKRNLPRGRFITQHLISLLNRTLAEFDPTKKGDVARQTKVLHVFCKKLIQLALDGDSSAIKMIMDRIEGTPISTMQFKEIPEGEETPDMLAAMVETQSALRSMTEAEQIALYRKTLAETGRTLGSA